VEDYSVAELEMQEAAAGLEVTIMLERVARGHTVLSHPPHLQVGIRAQVSDPQPEGKSGNFLHVMERCERQIYDKRRMWIVKKRNLCLIEDLDNV
jgi:hypothetical protein